MIKNDGNMMQSNGTELFRPSFAVQMPGAEALYFRVRAGHMEQYDGIFKLYPGSVVSTDTYFNIFSSSKYSVCTTAKNISITTTVSGNLEVELHSCSDISDEVIDTKKIISDSPEEVCFFFNIEGLDDTQPVCHYILYRSLGESMIYSFGSYYSDSEPDTVDMGIVICTFKREQRVLQTLERLNDLLSGDEYAMPGNTTVYVIDNGRTIEKNQVKYDFVKLIPNKNNGGAGGYAKGITEARKDSKTHILLMDDDVVVDINTIYKTAKFLSILNENHRDAFILGGMLLPETPTTQYEAGAERIPVFKGGKSKLDLSLKESLLANDRREPAQYGGWWYHCMPAFVTDELPLPVFIKMDDVMFGLRHMKNHVVMNGIGIWHDSFESKANPVAEFYYLRRNTLIFDSVYGSKNGFKAGIDYLHTMLHCIKEGKNKEFFYTKRALRDFLKGPQALLEDSVNEILNIQVLERGHDDTEGTAIKKIVRNSNFKELSNLFLEGLNLILNWNKIAKEYRDSMEYLTSVDFWEKFNKPD